MINIIKCCQKVLKKVKLPLSKETIEKLSTADPNTIFQFLKSLKLIVDELEHEKQLRLEKNQNCPLYIIVNDDIIQVTGIISIIIYLIMY